MMRLGTLLSTAAVLSSALYALPTAVSPEVRLVLQITVDQLRGDLPLRYADRFGKGGFRYLLEDGIWYTNAHYQHANTETVVGHTSLATAAAVGPIDQSKLLSRTLWHPEPPQLALAATPPGRWRSGPGS